MPCILQVALPGNLDCNLDYQKFQQRIMVIWIAIQIAIPECNPDCKDRNPSSNPRLLLYLNKMPFVIKIMLGISAYGDHNSLCVVSMLRSGGVLG
jgi:hypothetical protein